MENKDDSITSSKLGDTVFKHLFRNKKYLRELIHLLTKLDLSSLSDDEIRINDDDIFYQKFNDLVVEINKQFLVFCEHQSTWNPNMPMRFGFYAFDLYRKRLGHGGIYSHSLSKFPTPRFYVIYNGIKPVPSNTLYLRDAFEHPESAQLDLQAYVLDVRNIDNLEKLSTMHPLYGYSYLIKLIKQNQTLGYTRDEAVSLAVKECISKDILKEYLETNLEEVAKVFSKEDLENAMLEGAKLTGIAEGEAIGRIKGKIELLLEMNRTPSEISTQLNIPLSDVQKITTELSKMDAF